MAADLNGTSEEPARAIQAGDHSVWFNLNADACHDLINIVSLLEAACFNPLQIRSSFVISHFQQLG